MNRYSSVAPFDYKQFIIAYNFSHRFRKFQKNMPNEQSTILKDDFRYIIVEININLPGATQATQLVFNLFIIKRHDG